LKLDHVNIKLKKLEKGQFHKSKESRTELMITGQVPWLTLVIPATQEVEIRKITV
jgi:hypothetical protein